ncbi:MAG: ATP-dependent zinc metalloprotease FtsH [Candidatus Tyloplasma litorale]|nr:MAG: ATP-dependent zinc metalloprotease FtsH [Mycoplasmatales bacterium]
MNTEVVRRIIGDDNKKSTNKPDDEKNQQTPSGGNKPPVKKKSNGTKWIWIILVFILTIMLFSALFSTQYVSFTPDTFRNLSNDQITNMFDGYSENGQVSLDYYTSAYSTKIILQFQANDLDGSGTVVYRIQFDTMDAFDTFLGDLNERGLSYTFVGFEIVGTSSPLWSLFWGILPWILILGGTYWIMMKVMKSQGSIGNMNKSSMLPQVSNIKFSDVAGYDEVKAELWEIVDFLKAPEKYNIAGARTPKGVLLSGPPGTGKTFLAKAVAGEAGIPFYSISGSDFVEMFVGVGAKRVRELFTQAKAVAPALIFIDELDAVGRQRGAGMGGGNDEREQTLNQMLVEMDGFSPNSGVVVVAATNRPDVLDPALKRPGRFDRSIEFRMPDIIERESILKIYAKQGDKKFSKNVSWANVAGRTPGFSAAQLENVINEAAILSIRLRKKEITLDIIDEAIDRVIGGPSKSNNLMSKEEKKLIAYHEAGHAIVGLALEDAEQVQKITIIPRGQAGGYVLMTPKKEKFVQTKLELKAKLASYMAGRASEEIYFGKDNITTGAYSDIESATSIARRMVTEFGMSDLGPIQYEKPQGSVFLGRDYANASKNYSGQLAHEIDKEIRKLIDSSYKTAFNLVNENKAIMDILAESLLIKETLTAEEAEFIYKEKKLPEQVQKIKDKFQPNKDKSEAK